MEKEKKEQPKTVEADHVDQISKAKKSQAKLADLAKADQARKAKSKADLAKALKEKKLADPVQAVQVEADKAKAGMVKPITIIKADTALSLAMKKAEADKPNLDTLVNPPEDPIKAKRDASRAEYQADRTEAKAARQADKLKRRAEKKEARQAKGSDPDKARKNGFDPPLRADNRRKVSLLMPEAMFQAFLAQVKGDKSAFKGHILALLDAAEKLAVAPAESK